SEYSDAGSFRVFTPVVIQAPALAQPADGATLTAAPTLVVTNAQRTGPAGAIKYLFEVASDAAMARKVSTGLVPEGNGQTSFGVTETLTASTLYFWHVRALDG